MIATVISFCTNEWRTLQAAIKSVTPFSDQILVTVCDHFFDGSEENYALLQHLYSQFPTVQFIQFTFDLTRPYRMSSTMDFDHPLKRHEWHNTGRWISYFFLKPHIETILFCDADEVIDTSRFISWLKQTDLQRYSVQRLASYRYFREAAWRSNTSDLTATLVRKKGFDPDWLWSEHERMGIYLQAPEEKLLDVIDGTATAMVHHYSWVKTEEEMLKKTTCWGHYWERDWKSLIHKEYAHPFQGCDFVRKEHYHRVDPFFDPLKLNPPILQPITLKEHQNTIAALDNVIQVTPHIMHRKETLHAADICSD